MFRGIFFPIYIATIDPSFVDVGIFAKIFKIPI